jgi:hypothetical protein
MLGSGLLLGCLCGCQGAAEPKGGPLSAGPYPESRSVIEWIRIHTDDPEARVTQWGKRTEEKQEGGGKDKASVVIEVHYQSSIGGRKEGRWKQTLRVIGPTVREETQPVAE